LPDWPLRMIADFRAGFEIMRSGQSGKVILDWAA
jgi:hypothetical protein